MNNATEIMTIMYIQLQKLQEFGSIDSSLSISETDGELFKDAY